ncbi:MAG: ankyrin repeat domain-containing protein [Alphaproteobacteria bacterium]|nr:ankyrin repeat domain-containing protein [Alphaproteobacteria bacterium]
MSNQKEREKMGLFSLFFKKLFNLKSPIEQLFELAKNEKEFNEIKFFKIINKNETLEDVLSGRYASFSSVDLNTQDQNGNTLLHLLAGNSFLSDYLLIKGADASILNNLNQTALEKNIHRISKQDLLLIKSTATTELNKIRANGETILTELLQKNAFQPKILQTLIEKGVDIHQTNQSGHTPLYYAALSLNIGHFKYSSTLSHFLLLTEHGAKFNENDLKGVNLFQKIQKQSYLILGYPDTATLSQKNFLGDTILFNMLKKPIDYTFGENSGIFSLSTENIREKIIEKVISLSNIHEKDENGLSLIETALLHHRYQFLVPLIEKGADISFKNEKKETLLHFAILREDKKTLTALLKRNEIDINSQDQNGNTPLHLALFKEKEDIIDLLLAHSANPLIQNNEAKSCVDLSEKAVSKTIPLKIKIKQLEMENHALNAKLISKQKTPYSKDFEHQR